MNSNGTSLKRKKERKNKNHQRKVKLHLHQLYNYLSLQLCVLQDRVKWVNLSSIIILVCNLFNSGFVFQPEIICGFPTLKWEQASRRDICFAFNGYHKCFCYSTPSKTALPFSTLPNYSSGMKVGLFALQSVGIFPS